jgi:hypothetical protein
MKRSLQCIAAGMLFTSILVVSAAAQTTSIHYDRNYDFSKVKTFTIQVSRPWDNRQAEAYAEAAIKKELVSRGLTEATDGASANAFVVVMETVQDATIQESFYTGSSDDPNACAGPAGVSNSRTIGKKLTQRTVNILDAQTNQLIFSGVIVGEFSGQEKKNEQDIKKGVQKIFKEFPRKTTGEG